MWKYNPAESTFFHLFFCHCPEILVSQEFLLSSQDITELLNGSELLLFHQQCAKKLSFLWISWWKASVPLPHDLSCWISIVTCEGNSFSSNPKWSEHTLHCNWKDNCYQHKHWNFRNSCTSWTIWQDQSPAFLSDSGGQHQRFERRFVDAECSSAKLVIMLMHLPGMC